MTITPITIIMNMHEASVRASRLSLEQGISPSQYIKQVLLRHLEQLPEVDLSQSPYSKPKGVSNGK